jgi:hypothetical protein
MLAAFVTLLAHPCLVPVPASIEAAPAPPAGESHHAGGAAVDPPGCEPEGTAGSGLPAPGAAPAAPPPVAAARDVDRRSAGRLDGPPASGPRAPLYLLHAALLA